MMKKCIIFMVLLFSLSTFSYGRIQRSTTITKQNQKEHSLNFTITPSTYGDDAKLVSIEFTIPLQGKLKDIKRVYYNYRDGTNVFLCVPVNISVTKTKYRGTECNVINGSIHIHTDFLLLSSLSLCHECGTADDYEILLGTYVEKETPNKTD
ncbi:hypothetical protein ACFLS1_07780 [Verrucomicrobiota bacterium]